MSSRFIELLRAHGANVTSFQSLEPGMEHWICARGDGAVAYSDTGGAWVALGEPIAPPERRAEIVEEFIDAAAERDRRVRFFALEEPSSSPRLKTLRIGEQPLWRPTEWPEVLAGVRSLREQLRRARAKGVAVRELDGAALGAGERRRITELAARWKQSRSMAPMRFAVTLDLFGHAGDRRYFVAEKGGALVGALVAIPIFARRGWMIEDLLREPAAPNGTTELLFDAAMRGLADSGAEIVSMGMAPLSGISSRLLRGVAAATRWLFDFAGLRAFKAKLRPERWEPVYAAFPRRERGFAAIEDVLRCFAGGGLVRFAVHTALHRRRAVLWLLAALLIPWTAALASPGAGRFFPGAGVRAAWIAYDAVLFAGLASLVHRWSRPLAHLLALGYLADAACGGVQAALWNIPRASGADWLAIGLAIAAPLGAFVYLAAVARRY